jgi:hypothetical protein
VYINITFLFYFLWAMIGSIYCYNFNYQKFCYLTFTTKILGFPNAPSWLTSPLWQVDMSNLTKGSKHVFFDQPTWL